MSRMLRPPPSLGLASQSDCAREGEAITVCVVVMEGLYSPAPYRTIPVTEMLRFVTINNVRDISQQETPHQRNTGCSTQIGWIPCFVMVARTKAPLRSSRRGGSANAWPPRRRSADHGLLYTVTDQQFPEAPRQPAGAAGPIPRSGQQAPADHATLARVRRRKELLTYRQAEQARRWQLRAARRIQRRSR